MTASNFSADAPQTRKEKNTLIFTEQAYDLRGLLSELLHQQMIGQNDIDCLMIKPRGRRDLAKHPLVYVGEQKFVDLSRSGKILDTASLVEWAGDMYGLEVFTIDPLKIKAAQVTQVMSFEFAKKHKILAVDVQYDKVRVATVEPFNTSWVENLEHVLNKPVDRVFVNPDDIQRFTTEFYTLVKSVHGASSGNFTNTGNLEAFMQIGALKNPDANDDHIVNLVDWLFQYAFDQRASDIHIEPRREIGYVRFRIDGVLHQVYEMPMQPLIAIVSRIKTLGRLDISEKRKPQDGRLKTKTPEGQEVELRLSTLPTAFGEKMVMRIFDPEVLLKTFDQLGLVNQDYERWKVMSSKSSGIVLVTGPTGSGKTTTLYSTLKQLATSEVNVCTIEDPIEMIEDSFNQMQVHHAIGLDFATGVKALLRQDPDIIMIGEIRDQETASMAVQAALTGHLVLSTLHTNDAPTAITRLQEVGLPSYLIKATLIGVMAQRLVRILCPHCKQETKIDKDQWNVLVMPWKIAAPEKIYRAEGCLECRNTGFLGREGIYEILPISSEIQRLISADMNLADVRRQAMKEGMRTLRLSGAQKVINGRTTVEEVLRVAPEAAVK